MSENLTADEVRKREDDACREGAERLNDGLQEHLRPAMTAIEAALNNAGYVKEDADG